MASGAKRPDFRDAVIDYCEKFYQKPFDNLTSSERSKGLTRYYLINVYGPLHEEIDDDEIEQGFVDGSNDLGVDFFIEMVKWYSWFNQNIEPRTAGKVVKM